MPALDKVFVYGTLKRGFHNDWLMEAAEARLLGAAHMVQRYPLIIKGLPYLVNLPGTGHHVKGELYEATAHAVRMLDSLEGHPRWYRRERVDVQLATDCAIHRPWVYFIGDPPPLTNLTFHESFNHFSHVLDNPN